MQVEERRNHSLDVLGHDRRLRYLESSHRNHLLKDQQSIDLYRVLHNGGIVCHRDICGCDKQVKCSNRCIEKLQSSVTGALV